jgi:hypothetical protein
LGGVTFEGESVIYAFRDLAPMDANHIYTRVTYTRVSTSHFTWTGEKSGEGKTWSEFMVVNCHRVEQ